MENSKEFLLVESKFPRIAANLKFLWGNPEFTSYVYRLIEDTRDGVRRGFPSDVFFAILDILDLHDKEYPQHAKKFLDIWEVNNLK